MRESESGAEQARELESLRSTIEALMADAKNASPDKLRRLKAAIEGLSEKKSPVVPVVEVKEPPKAPSGIDTVIAQWNRGEALENGYARGSMWFVRTAEGRVFVLPNPSERNRYAVGEICYYYDVSQDTKLNQQTLTKPAEIFSGKDGMPEDSYRQLGQDGRIPGTNFTRGKFSV